MNTTSNPRATENDRLLAMNLASNPIREPMSEPMSKGSGAALPAQPQTHPISKKRLWAGRVASGLAVAFLLFDSITKVLQLPWVVKASTEAGFPAGAILPIGLVLLACTIVYCIPRTAILGAVLLTGYLGGAVELNVQAGNPLASNTLFPVYFAVLVWGGLALRDRRLWKVFARSGA
jgi:hypothetical protein